MSSRLSQQKPQGPTWSNGGPPARRARSEDFDEAPRLCSLAWAAWLVGMPPSTFGDLMRQDQQLRDRLSYAAPGRGRRWYFTARVWDWVDGRQWKGPRIVPDTEGR